MQSIVNSPNCTRATFSRAALSLVLWAILNGCAIATMFYSDNQWLLGRVDLITAVRISTFCAFLCFAFTLAWISSTTSQFRRKFGWQAWIQLLFLISGSLILFSCALLAESKAIAQFIAHGTLSLSPGTFLLWALLPLIGAFAFIRMLLNGRPK